MALSAAGKLNFAQGNQSSRRHSIVYGSAGIKTMILVTDRSDRGHRLLSGSPLFHLQGSHRDFQTSHTRNDEAANAGLHTSKVTAKWLGLIKSVSAPGETISQVVGHFFGIRQIDNPAHDKPGNPICIQSPRQIVPRRN